MTLLGAIASITLKKATLTSNMLLILKSPHLYIGGMLYLIAAILNIRVLRAMNYSIVMPLTSITYIWTILLAKFCMDENLNMQKISGGILICIGAIVITI